MSDLDITLTWLDDSRADEAIAFDHEVWFQDPDLEPVEMIRSALDWTKALAAEEAGRIVGLLAGIDQQVTAPGPDAALAQVRTWGLSWAGVHGDVRRRGMLRRLMQAHLERARAEGYPLVALTASEHSIYPRFGFGVATWEADLELGAGAEFTGAPQAVKDAADATRTRLLRLDSDEARAIGSELRQRWAPGQLGAVLMADERVASQEQDVPAARVNKEPERLIVAERDGVPVGMARVQRTSKWEDRKPQGTAEIWGILATDAGALLALARRATSFDLVATTTVWGEPPMSELIRWSGGPRGAKTKGPHDALWLRLVDVPAALTARGYAAGAPLTCVIGVLDDQLPENHGPWRLGIDAAGVAAVEPAADAAPDLTLPVQVLGAAFLGQDTLATLAGVAWPAGEVAEHTPGTLRALSAAMRRDEQARMVYHF